MTVVPWSGDDPGEVAAPAHVERLFANELVRALSRATERLRVRALLRAATPIATAKQAEAAFSPYLEAEDEWLRHTAIAGLAYSSPTPENVERAVADLRTFIRQTPPDARYEDPRPMADGGVATARVSAYGMLFAGYRILRSDWSDAERRRLRPLLPLYRVVATELTKEPILRWLWGIEPLCRIGEDVDLPTLYDYYRSHSVREDGRMPHSVAVRCTVIRRLTAVLGVPFVLTATETGLAGEAEQRALIDEALAKRLTAQD